MVIQQLIQLGERRYWGRNAIRYIKQDLEHQLKIGDDKSIRFILQVVKLLTGNRDKYKYNHTFNPDPPMDKLLHYQVEQERIFEQIKVQIGQNLNLSEIIQMAIQNSFSFLKLDRLLIYQLDVPLKSDLINDSESSVSAITYEVKSPDVASSLYFQEEICWNHLQQCKAKYLQGFNLAINDVDRSTSLNPCLKQLIQKFQVKAKAAVPIHVRRELWGLIVAHQCSETRQWNHQDIQFLRQIAEYIAIAIYHHQSYQQLQQQKDLLEKQVQAQAQQIKDALIAAEAASKSKHEFLGSMSHELRTPLTCVIGLSSTLLQWSSTKSAISLSPEKQKKYLHLIQQNGKHLLGLINNILEFSDVESGKHLLNIQKVSLIDVVRQSMQIVRKAATDKNITLSSEVKLESDREYFFADEIRLKEILYNLLSNGIKFTPERGTVTLRVWREKRQVVFQVEDTGMGIAADEIPLLFEKFKQLEHFKDRTHGGTGLGLALTKKLIELHGGNIEIESELNQGTLFTVYLPVKTFEPDLNHQEAGDRSLAIDSPTIVLITEDEEIATFMCQLLNTIDCQVVWLMDLVMAIEQIELLKPKLIVIDRDFGLTGIKNINYAVQNSSLNNSTRLIVLGDRYDDEREQNFVRSQVEDYIGKSMNPAQIVNRIKISLGDSTRKNDS
ncbi:MAG: ATP-binding protein [Cyanobacteria bacterium P01_G01_bin.19]